MFLDNVIFHFYKGGGVTPLTNVNKKMVFFNEGFPNDCSVFKLSYRFGLAVQSGVSGPQGADSAPSVLWNIDDQLIKCLNNW